jgi:hypothetical protein
VKKLLTIAAMGLGLVAVGMNTSANAADFVKVGYGYGGGYGGYNSGYHNNGGWNGNHNGGWNHGGYNNGGWNNGGWNHNLGPLPPVYRPAPGCGTGYGSGYGYGGGYGYGSTYRYPTYNNGVVISTPGFGLGYGW